MRESAHRQRASAHTHSLQTLCTHVFSIYGFFFVDYHTYMIERKMCGISIMSHRYFASLLVDMKAAISLIFCFIAAEWPGSKGDLDIAAPCHGEGEFQFCAGPRENTRQR